MLVALNSPPPIAWVVLGVVLAAIALWIADLFVVAGEDSDRINVDSRAGDPQSQFFRDNYQVSRRRSRRR